MTYLFRKDDTVTNPMPVNLTFPMKPVQMGRWRKDDRKLLLDSTEGFMATDAVVSTYKQKKKSSPYKCDTSYWDMKYK